MSLIGGMSEMATKSKGRKQRDWREEGVRRWREWRKERETERQKEKESDLFSLEEGVSVPQVRNKLSWQGNDKFHACTRVYVCACVCVACMGMSVQGVLVSTVVYQLDNGIRCECAASWWSCPHNSSSVGGKVQMELWELETGSRDLKEKDWKWSEKSWAMYGCEFDSISRRSRRVICLFLVKTLYEHSETNKMNTVRVSS